MAPFRNFLGRKNQSNGGEPDGFDENHLSPNPRSGPTPISIRKSQDEEPKEYKLSGTIDPFPSAMRRSLELATERSANSRSRSCQRQRRLPSGT